MTRLLGVKHIISVSSSSCSIKSKRVRCWVTATVSQSQMQLPRRGNVDDRLHRGCDWNINHEYEFRNFGMLLTLPPLWQKDNVDMGEGSRRWRNIPIYRCRKVFYWARRAQLFRPLLIFSLPELGRALQIFNLKYLFIFSCFARLFFDKLETFAENIGYYKNFTCCSMITLMSDIITK